MGATGVRGDIGGAGLTTPVMAPGMTGLTELGVTAGAGGVTMSYFWICDTFGGGRLAGRCVCVCVSEYAK